MATTYAQREYPPIAEIRRIGVIGAGQMGGGIAQVAAQAGLEVRLSDVSRQALDVAVGRIDYFLGRQLQKGGVTADEKAKALSLIHIGEDLAQFADCDLVIEAATENEELKRKIFSSLVPHLNPSAILASNTSSISITRLAAVTDRPERFIGMHFMNPVPVMKLVEVIRGYATSDEVCATIMDLSRKLEKVPVEVNDYPGFVANRILMPMINEAIYTLYEGVSGVEEIDTVMKLGMAHPMGPLQLADFIGLDVCLAILRVLHEGFGNPKYAPCPLLVNMVTAGKLGAKSGEGFYTYTPGSKDLVVSPRFR